MNAIKKKFQSYDLTGAAKGTMGLLLAAMVGTMIFALGIFAAIIMVGFVIAMAVGIAFGVPSQKQEFNKKPNE